MGVGVGDGVGEGVGDATGEGLTEALGLGVGLGLATGAGAQDRVSRSPCFSANGASSAHAEREMKNTVEMIRRSIFEPRSKFVELHCPGQHFCCQLFLWPGLSFRRAGFL